MNGMTWETLDAAWVPKSVALNGGDKIFHGNDGVLGALAILDRDGVSISSVHFVKAC